MQMNRQTTLKPMLSDDGFALIELMAVVLIIAILLGIAVAVFTAATSSANAAACRHNQQVLNRAISVARAGNAEIDEMADLETCVVNFEKASLCPADGTHLVYDSATDSVTCTNHP
jgi:prepilin-type N-terminal cleavage/methylation domain-containing protein